MDTKPTLKERAIESCLTRLQLDEDHLAYSTGNKQTIDRIKNRIEVSKYILEAVKAYEQES